MYSDIWIRDGLTHKEPPIVLSKEINLVKWVNESEEIIGITLNFEFAEDIHYEFLAGNWNKFIYNVLNQEPTSDYIPSLKKYFQAPNSHLAFGIALLNNKIEFKKISF